eukprot:CAMPEP_0116850350 /NCGR_PEP_ID=MMETSP0418-20121206/16106_1 /TAXON_ID=1158023 /ORGANISM="Astrosyne radiata, Strain 13vi08-1A" /LENGTH=157 /DNA_ID=CAMNT_0004482227 /DNA_START=8 /DNA_END=482 /DNA_ORIENTATION=-
MKTQIAFILATLSAAAAFSNLKMSADTTSRRNFLVKSSAAQSTDYEFPEDWGLSFKYDDDAARIRSHMVVATGLAKGSDRMEDFGKNMKKEMTDFVSYYRRFPNTAGKPSFSTLYTAINVLAGHYTSYGFKYPLPEKRRKRLYQEYAEISKSLKRGR